MSEPSLNSTELLAAINANAILVFNDTGVDITGPALVSVNGIIADGTPTVVLADADAGLPADYIVPSDIADGESGWAFKRTPIRNLDTHLLTVSAPYYLSATAGAFTSTRPTGASAIQIVGRVTVVSTLAGEAVFDLQAGVAGGAIVGQIRQGFVAGAAAGNLTVTAQAPTGAGSGPKVGDRLISVLSQDDTSGVFVALTSEFSITGNDTINNTAGTSTAAHHVLVTWEKLTP